MPILEPPSCSSLALLEREKRRRASGQEAWLLMVLLRLITIEHRGHQGTKLDTERELVAEAG